MPRSLVFTGKMWWLTSAVLLSVSLALELCAQSPLNPLRPGPSSSISATRNGSESLSAPALAVRMETRSRAHFHPGPNYRWLVLSNTTLGVLMATGGRTARAAAAAATPVTRGGEALDEGIAEGIAGVAPARHAR